MLTKSEFLKWAEGKKLDMDGVPSNQPYQCVDLVKYYLDKCYGIKNFTFTTYSNPNGYARGLWEHFDEYPQLKGKFIKIKNTPDFIPARGDIVEWNTDVGKAGHTAVATGRGNRSKFRSMDQNWNGKYYVVDTLHDYHGVYGVIRPLLKCTTANLNVRSGAGTSFPIVDELPKGTLVRPVKYSGSWACIGDGRWVSAKYLD